MIGHQAQRVLAMTAIKDAIRQFIVDNLLQGDDSVDLTNTTPLVSGGIIDSLTAIELGEFCEAAFGVQIPPAELANPEHTETIDALATLVSSRLNRFETN